MVGQVRDANGIGIGVTRYQAEMQLPPGTAAPDEYDTCRGFIPSDDFVVTRNKDGSALSLYGQLSWDRTPYHPDGRTSTINFSFWTEGELSLQRDQLTRELRWLMFVLIYLRPGQGLSNTTLSVYLQTFHQIARFCEKHSMQIQELLADPILVIKSLEERSHLARTLASLVILLNNLGPDVVGFDVIKSEAIQALQKLSRAWSNDSKQHPPIPTRIYSALLSALAQDSNAFEYVADRVLNLFEECASDPTMGRNPKQQRRVANQLKLENKIRLPTFSDLLRKYDLEDYWSARCFEKAVMGLSAALTEIMCIASIQIQAFTGMRYNEVQALPYHCLDEVKRDEDTCIHFIVSGRITKHAHGKIKRVQWVTSASGRAAILLAQRISKVIYNVRGETPEKSLTRINSHHLFISPYFALRRRKNIPACLELNVFPKLRSRLEPIINELDLLELEQIDPHRAWRTEKAFQIDQPWTLTSHQLRRSLALYAQRSGLVSLPSLKRQLQHITKEMSAYYCRGSAFAKDFISDDHKEKHFGEEWQETQPVSQFLSYVANVLLTDEPLFGVHPYWIEQRLRKSDGIVVFDREVTLRHFKNGLIAYHDTPLGGCIRVGECDKNPLDFLHVECLTTHCKNMVGNKTKLMRVIVAQNNLVEKLKQIDPKSPDCRHEKANLGVLQRTLANISKDSLSASK